MSFRQILRVLLLSAISTVLAFTRRSSISSSFRFRTRLAVTWSNGQAVQDYQNFLQSGRQDVERTRDGPSVIVRPANEACPLADALLAMGLGEDIVLTPGQDLPEALGGSSEYPVYVTLPPMQIEGFLQNLKDSYRARPEDFVFFAGGLEYGNIEDVLKDRGA